MQVFIDNQVSLQKKKCLVTKETISYIKYVAHV